MNRIYFPVFPECLARIITTACDRVDECQWGERSRRRLGDSHYAIAFIKLISKTVK
jgi:hypothetical protein